MVRGHRFGERKVNIKKQLNILIQLAKIDRDYDRREQAFVHDFGMQHGLNKSEIMEIENNPDYFVDLKTFSQDQKIEVLYNALCLAKVDQRILPNEIMYCQEVASKLGFRKKIIEFMLPLITNLPPNEVNYTALRRKLSPYL